MSEMSEIFDTANNVNPSRATQVEKYFGIYRAKCVTNIDKSKQSRIKVWVPALMKGTVDEGNGVWARCASNTYSGNSATGSDGVDDCGSSSVPPVGSFVFVFFEEGDPNNCWYFAGLGIDNANATELQSGSQWYNKSVIEKRPSGRLMMLSDDPSDAGVYFRGKDRSKGKRSVKSTPLRTDSMQMVVVESADGNFIRINDGSGNYVLIDEDGTIIQLYLNTGTFIKMFPSGIDMNVVGDLNIKASGNIRVNGTMIYLN